MMVEEMIREMIEREDVWIATGEEVALHVQKCIADGAVDPVIQNLPFSDGRLDEVPPEYLPR